VLRTDYVIVGMATIGVVGLAIDRVIRTVSARMMPWSLALAR
jgi:ABC-type nitrate/sulfonate/bicarbonate transport system permease component